MTITKPMSLGGSMYMKPLQAADGFVIMTDCPIGTLSEKDLDFIVSETDGIESWERSQPGDDPEGDKRDEYFPDRQEGVPSFSLRVKTCLREEPPHDDEVTSLQAFARHVIRKYWDPAETMRGYPDYDWQPVLPGIEVRLWELPNECVMRFPCPVSQVQQDWLDDAVEVTEGMLGLIYDSDLDDHVLRVKTCPEKDGEPLPDFVKLVRKLLRHLPALAPTGRSPLSLNALTFDQLQVGMWVGLRTGLTSTGEVISTLGSAGARLLVASFNRSKGVVQLVNPDDEEAVEQGGQWREASTLGLLPLSEEPLDWSRHFYLVPVA